MRVDVSGQKFSFPGHCACCGANPETTMATIASRTTGTRVTHTTSKSWEFPYCHQCVGHVNAAGRARTVTWATVIVSLVGAAYLHFFTAVPLLSIPVLAAGLGGGFLAFNVLMGGARAQCRESCVSVESAVGYYGWQGSCHMFEIASGSYALAFMVANRSKLVNVSPQTWQWLEANGYGQPANQPQAPKRYVS